jgi:hypothetical protein
MNSPYITGYDRIQDFSFLRSNFHSVKNFSLPRLQKKSSSLSNILIKYHFNKVLDDYLYKFFYKTFWKVFWRCRLWLSFVNYSNRNANDKQTKIIIFIMQVCSLADCINNTICCKLQHIHFQMINELEVEHWMYPMFWIT